MKIPTTIVTPNISKPDTNRSKYGRMKRHLQWRTSRPWPEHDHDPTTMIRTRTSHLAPARSPRLLLALSCAFERHFVWKITTFRAPAIYPNFTKYCACHEKWHSNITKNRTCHEKLWDVSDVTDVWATLLWATLSFCALSYSTEFFACLNLCNSEVSQLNFLW